MMPVIHRQCLAFIDSKDVADAEHIWRRNAPNVSDTELSEETAVDFVVFRDAKG
jgi:hypothetical protein